LEVIVYSLHDIQQQQQTPTYQQIDSHKKIPNNRYPFMRVW